jgi:hypothetical protein
MLSSEEIQVKKANFQKMLFLTNAIEKGWSVKKIDSAYVFCKKTENKKEVLRADYLEKFIESNLDINLLLQS